MSYDQRHVLRSLDKHFRNKILFIMNITSHITHYLNIFKSIFIVLQIIRFYSIFRSKNHRKDNNGCVSKEISSSFQIICLYSLHNLPTIQEMDDFKFYFWRMRPRLLFLNKSDNCNQAKKNVTSIVWLKKCSAALYFAKNVPKSKFDLCRKCQFTRIGVYYTSDFYNI